MDVLLILLKNDIIQRWYEFGLLIGVPKRVMDSYYESGCSADQCVIEVLDYWLRHYPGLLTWKKVAKQMNEINLHHLADRAFQLSETGRIIILLFLHNSHLPIV